MKHNSKDAYYWRNYGKRLFKYIVYPERLTPSDKKQLGKRKYVYSDYSYIMWGESFDAEFWLNPNFSTVLRKGEVTIPDKYRK